MTSGEHAQGHYDASYGAFDSSLYADIRREAFGEDIGQQSWITAGEQDRFIQWLNLGPGRTLLDVACGAGGPALRIAARTSCSIVGVDFHDQAIATARSTADRLGLARVAQFHRADARERLPFDAGAFDAITCVDAINHLPDRPRVVAEFARLLKPGGRLLFTDPVVITGPLTSDEISSRCSIGFFLFVPRGHDEDAIASAGLELLANEDTTPHLTDIARRRGQARAARRAKLIEIEGERTFHAQQEFFDVVARLGAERRLSRFMYVAAR